MLKNKRPTLAIIIFNSAIKIMLSLFVILALISFFSNIEILKTQYGDNLKSWEKIKNYAVLPDITDFDVMKSFMSKENRYKLKNLYLAYNKKGGILADFADFQPKTRGFNLKAIDKSYKRDRVMINPNYLKMFPVYDTKGNEVKIAEDNSNFVLLLPDKYKNQEKEIRTFYNIQKAYSAQKIEIIWIANKQKLFSAAMSINPAQGNFVNEPVVKVLTERNGIEIDYDRIINYQTSPFKIKISDLNNVEESVRPELKEIGINKYVPRVTMVYDSVAAEVKKAKDMMIYISLTLVALLGLATLMIFQNVVSYFEQYKLRLAIQKFHGYKAVDMYSSYLFLILISWIVTFCLALVLNISKPIELLECSAAFMLLEIGITLIIVNFVEKRKVLKVTKGG